MTLREACGLTLNETGAYLGCTLRAVQNWEAGLRGIPDAAVTGMLDLDKAIRDQVSRIVLPLSEASETVTVPLIRYRSDETYAGSDHAKETGLPRQAYHAMLWRAMDAITRLGHEYRVEWADDTGHAAEP
jgi:hypothetical protein